MKQRIQTRRFERQAAAGLALAAFLAAGGATAAGQATTVAAGALIIPMQANFQDACGTVSAYGLVYQMLAAEESIKTQKGRYINIHWAINPNKASPNRCVPTNLHSNPSTPAACAAAGSPWSNAACLGTIPYLDNQNSPNWNDGCDFTVTNHAGVPIKQVDTTYGSSNADKTSFTTINTLIDPGKTLSYPNYRSVLIQQAPAISPQPKTDVTAVQYLGGAFVIEAQDASIFLDVLRGVLTTTDATTAHNPLNFQGFTTGAGGCKTVVNSPGQVEFSTAVGGQNTNNAANVHYVAIHRAKASFTAYYGKDMNSTPGKIALLYTAGGQVGYSSAVNGIKSDMLPAYLTSAGLNTLTAARGCPPNGYNAKNAVANCPNGGVSGIIFDAFDVFDLQDSAPDGTSTGPLSNQDPATGGRVYQNLWIPHWEGTTFSAGRICDATCINTARATVKNFVSNQPVGVLAECGSIGVIEGTVDTGQGPFGGSPWNYPDYPGSGSDPVGGYPNAQLDAGVGQPADQIATCAADSVTPTSCSASVSPVRGVQHDLDPNGDIIQNLPLRNCTDPGFPTGSNCVVYAHPEDPYSQVGDHLWYPRAGLLSNYLQNSGALYNSSWTPLAYAVAKVNQNPSGDGKTLPTALQYRSQAAADLFSNTISPLSNSDYASSIIYLGGHTYASDVAGTRVVLNTMLAIGARSNPLESAIASPTAYNNIAYVASYFAIPPNQAIPPDESNFAPSLGSLFRFPFHKGDVQGHGLFGSGANALVDGANAFAVTGVGASAQAALPSTSPAVSFATINARNIFTYLGGVISAPPGAVGGMQTGWTPVDIDYPSVLIGSNCLDVFRIGEINATTKPSYKGPAYPGMLQARDGACDLQEALALTPISLGTDRGTSEGVVGGSIPNSFNVPSEVSNAEQLVQMVRGYCYATSTKVDGTGNFVPRPSYCNLGHNLNKKSIPLLGGFVHSQPAIIAASSVVGDLPVGKHRPTVMFVGGLDGMLHAFYVPSDGNDAGYTGPSNKGLHYPAASAGAQALNGGVFHTSYTGVFSPPVGLTELWAFIPPGQLPLLKNNSAKVDGSPVVLDVFADFANTGSREWHTVLVETAGGNNRELFALDVTNPLMPVLLWDLQPNFENASPTSLVYAPSWLADADTAEGGLAEAFVWQNNCRTSPTDPVNPCTPATFILPPRTDPGRSTTGQFNYTHLGSSEGVSAAGSRRHNVPLFAAYIATNEPQDQNNSGQGIYVFATDVSTGRKIWEFNNPYMSVNASQVAGRGNTPPPGVTLFSKAANNLVDTAYIGDDEGSLWELDAADGLNTTAYGDFLSGCSGGTCNYPLSQAFGAGAQLAQPISTLSSIFIVPQNYPVTGPLNKYQGAALLTYGTAGTDTISGLEPSDCGASPCITGNVHLLPIAPTGRAQWPDLSTGALRAAATQNGVAKEITGYPLTLPVGERIFGSLIAAGNMLFFATSKTSQGSNIDIFQGSTGASYQFDLTSPLTGGPSPFVALLNTSIGGAGSTPLLVMGTGTNSNKAQLVTTTTQGLAVYTVPNIVSLQGPPTSDKGQTPATFLGWFFRRRGSEY